MWPITGFPGLNGTPKTTSIIFWVRLLMQRVYFLNPPPTVTLASTLGVMPPDEYYSDVNNSVYTNAAAKLRFEYSHHFLTVNSPTNIRDGPFFCPPVSALRRIWPTSSIILHQKNGGMWPKG